MSTTNYEWPLPTPGASAGVWGNILNSTIEDIDAQVKAVDDVADAALPRAGGEMTGELRVHTDKFRVINLGNMSGTTNLDLAQARFFYGTVTGNMSFAFTNVPGSELVVVMVEVTNGGNHTVGWPVPVKWPLGEAPSLTEDGVDVVALYTRDGGTTWRGALAQEDSR